MLKNRTFLGILCILVAIALVFGISPLFTKLVEEKATVIRLTADVPQGARIATSMVEQVEVGSYNIQSGIITEPKQIVGKYAVSNLYKGDYLTANKLSDTVSSSDSLLRNLEDGETAMSITIRSFANGLSGKLQTGDVIQIVSVDDDDDKAYIYDELKYIEVLTTTASSGSDETLNSPNKSAQNDDEDAEEELPATITVVLQDEIQALRLAECENSSLHAILVYRGDDEEKSKSFIEKQMEIIKTFYPTGYLDTNGSTEESDEDTEDIEHQSASELMDADKQLKDFQDNVLNNNKEES